MNGFLTRVLIGTAVGALIIAGAAPAHADTDQELADWACGEMMIENVSPNVVAQYLHVVKHVSADHAAQIVAAAQAGGCTQGATP